MEVLVVGVVIGLVWNAQEVDIEGLRTRGEEETGGPFETFSECRAGTTEVVERRTYDRKVASSNQGRSGGRIFFSRMNFLC